MKKIIYILILCQFLISCGIQRSIFENGASSVVFKDFEPIDPTEYSKEVEIVSNKTLINKNIKLLTKDEILKFLNNETVLVYIGQSTTQGDFNYLPVTVSAKGETYKVVMDYMKFTTIAEYNNEGTKLLGFSRVGVGLRLSSQITTKEAGINIGDLLSLGIAVKDGKATGRLAIEVIGIKSEEVTTLLPFPSEINQTTIQNAMQALATIKSKLYDTETKLYPQIMAIKSEVNFKDSTSVNLENLDNNKIKIQVSNTKAEKARKLQNEAFDFIFNKNVESAIQKLDECNKIFPTYNNVYEIKRLLEKEKQDLQDKNSSKWENVYKTILENYSWNLPSEIINKLKGE